MSYPYSLHKINVRLFDQNVLFQEFLADFWIIWAVQEHILLIWGVTFRTRWSKEGERWNRFFSLESIRAYAAFRGLPVEDVVLRGRVGRAPKLAASLRPLVMIPNVRVVKSSRNTEIHIFTQKQNN